MSQTSPQPSSVKAVLWMLASVACFLLMSVAGRALTGHLHTFQILEIRSIIGWIMLLPLVFLAGGFGTMKTSRPLQHIGRNAIHYTGQFAWFFALGLIPLAELVSIEFTTPIWTALLAVLFLGEKMNRAKLTAIALGLIGVVIIVRPGLETADRGHLVMLAGAVAFGVSVTMTKSLTRTEGVTRIIFWMLIIQSAIGMIPAYSVWKTPTIDMWPALLAVSFTGTFSHFCMARALSYGDATSVMPIDFLRVPFSALIGWVLYNEGVDVFTAAGAALIIAGNVINLSWRKRSDAATSATPMP